MGIAERRNREFQRREREILDAALRLLSGEDWQSVTVDEIAAAAEIGKGTVYKHFQSKDEIYGRLALDFHSHVLRDVRAIDPQLPVEDRIREITKVIWRAHTRRREYRKILEYTSRESFRQAMSPTLRSAFEELNSQQMEVYGSVLAQGMVRGLFPRRDLGATFLGPHALVNGMILMIWAGCFGDEDDERYVDELTDFMLAGLMYRDRLEHVDVPLAAARDPATAVRRARGGKGGN